MEKKRNDAFLILRIPHEFKEDIRRRAEEAGQDISKFVREKLWGLFSVKS